MSEFIYEATDQEGNIKNGSVSAGGKDEALEIIRSDGLTILSIDEEKAKVKNASKGSVKLVEKLLFFDHMGKMLNAGLSLSETLDSLVQDAETKIFKQVIEDLKYNVESGNKLSDSMKKYPKIFSPLIIKMMEIGETSGSIAENTNLIKDQVQKSYELRKKVKSAMMYPVIIMSIMLVVSIGLIIFVFPQLNTMFKGSGMTLPLPTQIMIDVSNILTGYGVEVLIVVIILIIAARALLKLPQAKYIWNVISIKIPIIGDIIKKINIINFARTLGNLLKSGIPINQSITIVRDTVSNEAYKKIIDELERNVEKGDQISPTLSKYPKLFPNLATRMIAVGDKTGNTSEMLLSVSEFYQNQVDDTLANLSVIIEPLMLFVMGGGVLLIALSVIMPIYQMTGSIGKTAGTSAASGAGGNVPTK
jgi:type IV pilus assembly protein PilC